MKKLILILVVLIVSACASMFAGVVARTDVNAQGEVRKYEPVDAKAYAVENAELKVSYVPDIVDAGIAFSFQNKTAKVVKIVWDESSFIDSTGNSERITHAGVRLMEKGATQPPSIIPPAASLTDDMVPTSHISFDAARMKYGSGWVYLPLCGTRSVWTHKLEDDACVGKTMGFFITYEIDGKKKNMMVRYKYLGKAEEKTDRATAAATPAK